MTGTEALDRALDWLATTQPEQLARLQRLVAMQSVAADPERHGAVRAAAAFLHDELTRIGFAARIEETGGQPAVVGEWLNAGPARPTVLAYAHYDVQPEDPLGPWTSPPFEATVRDDIVYGRGVSDDKGQLLMHLAAVEAFLATTGRLPINVRFLFEGEEEIGSPNLDAFLAAHRDDLGADLAVVTDGSMFDQAHPAVGYGVRGLVYLEVVVTGPASDLHSGGFGGVAPNPADALARMLASLHDDSGRVAVPGFYDAVRPPDPAERRRIETLPFDEPAFRAAIGARDTWGEPGFTTLERLWIRPTLDVNGLAGGFAGIGAKTIVPASASAKLSCRLVPDQEPAAIAVIVEAALRAAAPPAVSVDVRVLGLAPPAVVSLDHPAVAAAASALEAAYGSPAVFQRSGGTVPVVGYFGTTLGLPTVLIGFGLPTARTHAPNEFLPLANFARGAQALARFWAQLGADAESAAAAEAAAG